MQRVSSYIRQHIQCAHNALYKSCLGYNTYYRCAGSSLEVFLIQAILELEVDPAMCDEPGNHRICKCQSIPVE